MRRVLEQVWNEYACVEKEAGIVVVRTWREVEMGQLCTSILHSNVRENLLRRQSIVCSEQTCRSLGHCWRMDKEINCVTLSL